MVLKDTIRARRGEILTAVISSLLTGVLSLGVGLYSLSRSVEMAQVKERRNMLRAEITILKKVERELGKNVELLLAQNLQATVEFERVQPEVPKGLEHPQLRAFVATFLQEYTRDAYSVTKTVIPTESFQVSAWPYGGYNVLEMDFDVSQEIHELYVVLGRVNHNLDQMRRSLTLSRHLGSVEVYQIRAACKAISGDIETISKDRIMKTKDRDMLPAVTKAW